MDGLCELHLTKDMISDVRAVYGEWSRPWTVYELVLKKSAKELDPRRFNPLERKTLMSRTERHGRNGCTTRSRLRPYSVRGQDPQEEHH